MNKLLYSTIFLSAMAVALVAAPRLTSKRNAIRPDDNLLKLQVEYQDPGSSGKERVWDFSSLSPIDYAYKLTYSLPDTTDTARICGREHQTRYYYLQHRDSLWALGYENNLGYVTFTQPELLRRYPMAYGDTLRSQFEGSGQYGRRFSLQTKGHSWSTIDAAGKLILPGTELPRTLTLNPENDTMLYATSFYYPPVEQTEQLGEEDNYDEENEREITEGTDKKQ